MSGLLVLFGGYVLAKYLPVSRCTGHYFGYSSWLSNWDGQWYQYIAHRGYHYIGKDDYGPQVFFPLYPLLGRLLDVISPLHGQLPLIAVSWLAAWSFCLVWMRYAEVRIEAPRQNAALWGLALILLWPVSYFLRVAYTESLYLFLLTLFFYGCARQWHPLSLVAVTGLLTATRPTALLVCVVLALHLFLRARHLPLAKRLLLSALIGVASAWGMYAYIFYLYLDFGNPLLFVTKQMAWNYQMPADIFFRRWQEMLSLRPAWIFLVDGSLLDPSTYPWNLQNRAMWLVSLVLIAIGGLKRWLNAEELLFCVLTVLLIYYTHAAKNMESVGRYVFTLVPLYLVLTRLLLRLPLSLRLGVLALSATLLAVQSAHFSLWHCVF
jgi:hypothetical protein